MPSNNDAVARNATHVERLQKEQSGSLAVQAAVLLGLDRHSHGRGNVAAVPGVLYDVTVEDAPHTEALVALAQQATAHQ